MRPNNLLVFSGRSAPAMPYLMVMDDVSDKEVVHLKVDEHLPAVPSSVPAAEVLKQLLEQMLENERRRVRNEFIRIGSVFLVLLLLIMGGGFWIAHDILSQVKETRLMSEHSQDALLTLLSAASRQGSYVSSPPVPAVIRDASVQPESRNGIPAENPVEIQATIARLEEKNKALSELMQTENASMKNLLLDVLKNRDTEIHKLRSKINSKQAQVIKSKSVDLDTALALAGVKSPEQRAASVTLNIPDRPLVKSLRVPVADDMPLRMPIPLP